jgi:hypothetical protein
VKMPKTSLWIIVLALVVSLGVTILDHLPTSRGVPWYGLFVIPVIWIALWSAEDDVFPLMSVAFIVTGLALLPVLSSFGREGLAPYTERVVVLASIWLTVTIALLRKRAQRTYKWIRLLGRNWSLFMLP